MNRNNTFLLVNLLRLIYCTLLQVTVKPYDQLVSTPGRNARFFCLPDAGTTIEDVHWTLNDVPLEDFGVTNARPRFSRIGNGRGTLIFRGVHIENNNTLIGCSAMIDFVEVNSTNKPLLLLQGELERVHSLQAMESDSELLLTWDAPFTLDITDVNPDVNYTVQIYLVNSSSTTLISEYSIVSTEFNTPIPDLEVCDRIFIVVIPVNEAGNGMKTEMSYFPPHNSSMLETFSRISVNSGIFTYMLNLSEGICSGEMVAVDVNTGETIIIEEVYFNIVGDHINFSTEQLPSNRLYMCSLVASNQNGLSESLFNISLHDLQNIEIEFSSTAVTVTAVYFKHSTARGAIIRILYVMDDGSVDYTKSPIIVLDRSTPPGYVLPFKLYAGSYLVFAHDIESDGTLQDGVGFPAVTREFTAGGNSSGPFDLAALHLLSCGIDSSSGMIEVHCSSPDGSTATGFQVMAHLSNSSAASKVYVNKSKNFEFPVILEVEENGTYLVALLAIGEVPNPAMEYIGSAIVGMKNVADKSHWLPATLSVIGCLLVTVAVIVAAIVIWKKLPKTKLKIRWPACKKKGSDRSLPVVTSTDTNLTAPSEEEAKSIGGGCGAFVTATSVIHKANIDVRPLSSVESDISKLTRRKTDTCIREPPKHSVHRKPASEDVESADGSLNHLPLNFDGLASAETNPQATDKITTIQRKPAGGVEQV